MKLTTVTYSLGVFLCSIGNLSVAAERVDFGREEYRENCLICHGEAGDGNGPYAHMLTKSACDLTKLARENRGVFPFTRVYEVIDGREMVQGHGTRDMPVWGSAYRVLSGEVMFEVPYNPELFVRSRILALIEYISRLQK